jgi:peptidoglycan/LPS O-acetylase OafA/YrhL
VFGPEMYLRINTIWSLRWEWLFYLCLPLLAYLRALSRATLFAVFLTFVFYDPADLVRGVETEASFILAFYLGVLSTYVPRLKARVPVVGSAANLAALACLALFVVLTGFELFGPGALEPKIRKAPFVLTSSLFFFACVMVKHAPPAFMRNRSVLLVGKISYSLYLWQLFINYHGVRALQPLIGLDSLGSYLITMAVLTAAVTAVSMLSYRIVEWPFLRPAERVDVVNPEHALGRS